MRRFTLFTLVAGLLGSACDDGPRQVIPPTNPGMMRTCMAGQVAGCICPTGSSGTQVCGDDGRFSECMCGLTPDTGVVANTDTGVVGDTDTGVVVNSDTGVVVNTDTGVVVNSDTGVVVTTDTGVVVNTDTGVVVNTDTGVVVTADTGVVVNTDGGVVDPDTGVTPGCGANPNMCAAFQLIGPAPSCSCLAACQPGFVWVPVLNACIPIPDAGFPDTGPAVDAGVPPSDPFDPATAAAGIATAICQHRTRCEPAFHSFLSETEAQCTTRETAAYNAIYAAYPAMLAGGRVGYSQTAYDACINAMATADCHQGLAPGVCDDLFTGVQPVRQPCYFNTECDLSGYCASGSGLGSCGTCAARVGSGADCSTALCLAGNRCLTLNDGSQACVPDTVPLGGACGTVATGLCNGRMQCAPSGMAFTCQLPSGAGQTCDPMLTTGTTCNIYEEQACVNNVCTMARFNAPGGSCADPDQCNSDGECNTGTNMCVAYPAAGQPCLNSSCADTAYCDGTFCQAKSAQGGMCTGSVQCQTDLFCVSGTCQNLSWNQCN